MRSIQILVALFPLLIVCFTNCTQFSVTDAASGGAYPIIKSNFKTSDWIWGEKGQPGDANCGPGADGSGKPDVVGAFRFLCVPSHNLYDDPVVFPGRPGASHLHTFFGNTEANAHSTFESLRTTGDGSCSGGPLNRSAYWHPAMMNGAGKVVMPDYVTVYYKRRPKSDPYCQVQGKECVGLPRGLRMVFGYNMNLPPDDPKQMHPHWMCDGGFANGGQVEHATIGGANCPVGQRVGSGFSTPDCWDGINLDSPDHRSHLAYAGYGDTGIYKCPTTHPYVIPAFTMKAWWSHDDADNMNDWYLSSDRMEGHPVYPSGSTLHSDWFGAWDDDIMAEWMENAIDKFMNCSDGTMGSGRQLKRPTNFAWNVSPRLVDPPQMTAAMKAAHEQGMIEMHKMMKHGSDDEPEHTH